MSTNSSPSKDKSSTKDWLESILEGHYSVLHPQEDEDLNVLEWVIEPVEGENYLSEMLLLDVRYSVGSQDKRAQLVAKLLPQEPYNRAFVIETQFDLREIKFYTEIRPALEEVVERRIGRKNYILPSPDCFHAVYKEDCESILVMEDLTSKGFCHQDLTTGLTLLQAESAVKSLVEIHSAAIAFQKEENQGFRRRFPYLLTPTKAIEAFRSLFDKGLPLLLKYLQKRLDYASLRTKLEEYCSENRSKDILQKVLLPSDKLNTLVHCDFWSNNLMFKKIGDTTQCYVIDWQMVMYGRLAIDLSMLITTSLSPQMRRSQENYLVKFYWNSLIARLQELKIKENYLSYSFEDLEHDVANGMAFGALIMVGSVDMALGNPDRENRVLSLLTDLVQRDLL